MLLCDLLFSVTTISTAHALSAITANTIRGTTPYLEFDNVVATSDLEALLSIKLPGGNIIKPVNAGTKIEAEKNWTYDGIKTFVDADGGVKQLKDLSNVKYKDSDGDSPHATTPVSGTLKVTWSYKAPNGLGGWKTVTLGSGDLTGQLNSCYAPYTLTIEAAGVKTESAYGDPIDYSYPDNSVVYTINVKDYKFCYARPNQMNAKATETWVSTDDSSGGAIPVWNNASKTAKHSTYGGGYSSDFFPHWGFDAGASTKFPTTGFIGAQFDLLMSNAQDDYTYSSSEPSSVKVDSNGTVVFKKKPLGEIIITATPKDATYPPQQYKFKLTGIWAAPSDKGLKFYNDAITECSNNESNIPTRAGLTNSPTNSAPSSWSSTNGNNYFYREITGGLFGEWGQTNSITYPESKWNIGYYWTKDPHDNTNPFIVHSTYGTVSYVDNGVPGYTGYSVVCKE